MLLQILCAVFLVLCFGHARRIVYALAALRKQRAAAPRVQHCIFRHAHSHSAAFSISRAPLHRKCHPQLRDHALSHSARRAHAACQKNFLHDLSPQLLPFESTKREHHRFRETALIDAQNARLPKRLHRPEAIDHDRNLIALGQREKHARVTSRAPCEIKLRRHRSNFGVELRQARLVLVLFLAVVVFHLAVDVPVAVAHAKRVAGGSDVAAVGLLREQAHAISRRGAAAIGAGESSGFTTFDLQRKRLALGTQFGEKRVGVLGFKRGAALALLCGKLALRVALLLRFLAHRVRRAQRFQAALVAQLISAQLGVSSCEKTVLALPLQHSLLHRVRLRRVAERRARALHVVRRLCDFFCQRCHRVAAFRCRSAEELVLQRKQFLVTLCSLFRRLARHDAFARIYCAFGCVQSSGCCKSGAC
mmetsp:Transcript_11624/g.31311  ORF Transcript_11624/g.31311 Transcript_11624/m.31311 type:complete len:420 (+) Transcript_11624:143-1402(+)